MSGTRSPDPQPSAMSRRTLLTGAAFAAGGFAATAYLGAPNGLAASAADASGAPSGIAGTITSRISPELMDVQPLGAQLRQRIEIVPNASISAAGGNRLTDLAVGDQIVAEGAQTSDGTIRAHRVMFAAFGRRQDVER